MFTLWLYHEYMLCHSRTFYLLHLLMLHLVFHNCCSEEANVFSVYFAYLIPLLFLLLSQNNKVIFVNSHYINICYEFDSHVSIAFYSCIEKVSGTNHSATILQYCAMRGNRSVHHNFASIIQENSEIPLDTFQYPQVFCRVDVNFKKKSIVVTSESTAQCQLQR